MAYTNGIPDEVAQPCRGVAALSNPAYTVRGVKTAQLRFTRGRMAAFAKSWRPKIASRCYRHHIPTRGDVEKISTKASRAAPTSAPCCHSGIRPSRASRGALRTYIGLLVESWACALSSVFAGMCLFGRGGVTSEAFGHIASIEESR
jgi:hypothetical protein